MRSRPDILFHGRHPIAWPAIALLTLFSLAILGAAALSASGASSQAAVRPASGTAKKPKPKAKPAAPLLRATGIVRWGDLYKTSSGYERYAYVIVGRQDARAAGRLPGTSLVYMSGTSVQTGWSTGVSYQDALTHGWLLKDANGTYLRNVQYGAYIGDIGDAAYQQRFVTDVAAFLKATKTKGVFIDDVLAHPGHLTGGVWPAKYATPDAWENAMVSFVAAVGPALRSKGYYVAVNALKFVSGDSRSDTGELTIAFWRRLAPYVSGLLTENWLQDPNDANALRAIGTNSYENWTGWQSLEQVAQGAGRDFFAIMYGSGSDVRAMRYGRGTFLLDWNGRGGAFIYFPRDRNDPYHRAWVTQFGVPLKPKIQRAPGVWQRRYAKGLVVVNATTSPVALRVNGALQTVAPTDALFSPNPR